MPTSVKNALAVNDVDEEEEEVDIADKELTYRPMAQERRGANDLRMKRHWVSRLSTFIW